MPNDKAIKVGRFNIEIPNWDKIFYPKLKLKKSDIINYYEKISQHMLPFMKNRIITLHRFPDGINQEGFYQKKYQDYFPNFLKSFEVKLIKGGKQQQIICNKKADLIYLVGQGTIAFHVWLSKLSSLTKPNKIIFDLDPSEESNKFSQLKKAAFVIKEILSDLSLNSFVMTTGSRGLHIVIPIKATHNFDEIHNFARSIADSIAKENSALLTAALQKHKRESRIFIDYTRNAYGQTSISPYSLRAIKNAPIATPLDWDELKNIESSQTYTINNIFKRLAKKIPWKSFHNQSQILTKKTLIKVLNY